MTISWSRPLGRGGLPGAVISSAYGMRSGIALLMCFALHSPSGCSRAENQRNPNPTPVPIACVAPHFFEKYRGAGLATSARTDEIRIELPVDLHSADCGAPDSYGHRMTLRLTLGAESGRCRIRSAVADAHPYGDTAESGLEPWRDAFVPVNDPNLADSTLERIELRDSNTHHALLLMPGAYYFYENVAPAAQLKPELQPEAVTDCCYGYTSSAFSGLPTHE